MSPSYLPNPARSTCGSIWKPARDIRRMNRLSTPDSGVPVNRSTSVEHLSGRAASMASISRRESTRSCSAESIAALACSASRHRTAAARAAWGDTIQSRARAGANSRAQWICGVSSGEASRTSRDRRVRSETDGCHTPAFATSGAAADGRSREAVRGTCRCRHSSDPDQTPNRRSADTQPIRPPIAMARSWSRSASGAASQPRRGRLTRLAASAAASEASVHPRLRRVRARATWPS